MKNKRVKILIIVLAISLLIAVYVWYSPGKNQTPPAVVPEGPIEKQPLTEGGEILRTLSLLKNTTLDLEFFNNKLFKSLVDFSVELPQMEPGRYNPFAPLETGAGAE